MTQIALIVGNTGAGKSTYAARLSADTGAHVFTVDEWMATLFQADMPDPPSYEWALERTRRIDRQVVAEALRLADRGMPVLLDLGFFGREHRDRTRAAIHAGGHDPVIHYLDVDKDTRWRRVAARNASRGETFAFEVDRATFDFCETIFEPPDSDELVDAMIV